jgi:glycosyl transferase family 25
MLKLLQLIVNRRGSESMQPKRDVLSPPEPVPVFIIVLKNKSRADALSHQLTHLHIPFEIVDAVEGAALDAAALKALYDESRTIRRLGRPMGLAEIGCALSHRSVYRIMVERGIALGLVLEEDAILGPEFHSLWQAASALPAEVDLLILYSESGFVRREPHATLAGVGLHQATIMLSHAVGYFVRQACAKTLMHRTVRIDMVADWPLDHHDMRQYLAVPMPIGHGYVGSTIAADRPNKNLLGKFQVPRWLSALMHLTFLVYLLDPGRYEGPVSYYRREIAARLKRLFSTTEIDVGTLCLRQNMREHS